MAPSLAALAAAAVVAACATAPAERDPEDVRTALVERLGTWPAELPVLGQAAVQTPRGLWNVYVLSILPDRVLVHQVRQDGETTFGMTPAHVWGQDPRSGQVRAMGDSFRFFLRTQNLFRLGDRLTHWQARAWGGSDTVDGRACTRLTLADEGGNPVDICIDDETGLPAGIAISPPEHYGTTPIYIVPEEWKDINGQQFMAVYELRHGAETYHWNFQGISAGDPEQVTIEPPESLTDADGEPIE